MGVCLSRQSGGKQMKDTVTIARMEREREGLWEAEVSYGGEADLHRHLAGCDKSPGHHKFVPVDQFSVDHLPSGCQDNDLVDLVRVVSDLTVRVSVKHVSKKRPKKFPGSDKPFPCYKNRGSDMMRVGTGLVWELSKYRDEKTRSTTCPCQECRISPTPKTQCAQIHIGTAAHVVYDSLEAAHTTCHLFFDKGGTPHTCRGVVTLKGGPVIKRDIEYDWCEIIFVTHDLDLISRLYTMVDHRTTLNKRLKEKLDELEIWKQKSSYPAKYLYNPWDYLTIIVSHPHGCSKQISVGHCVDMVKRFGRTCLRTYTTATCPGSSGAGVFWVKGGWWGFYRNNSLVHSGNCEGNKNLNYCSNYLY